MKDYTDPRMHSAEHILNQTMVRMFDCGRCFSSHIEKKKSKCDYHFHRPLTVKEMEEIEATVNRIIQRDLPVRIDFMGREDAAAQFSLKRLPPNAGDQLRIVRMGDYDACPCAGTHVSSTREIGAFKLTTSNHQDGVLRIRFKLLADEHRSDNG
jgi:Ser-tRNA(Ala) deacylase AlaX